MCRRNPPALGVRISQGAMTQRTDQSESRLLLAEMLLARARELGEDAHPTEQSLNKARQG